MAYVRRTETMCDDVRNNIRNMEANALRPHQEGAIEKGTPEWDGARDAIQTAAYSDAPELKGKLPDNWLQGCPEIYAKFRVESSDPEEKPTYVKSVIYAKEGMKIKIPKHIKDGTSRYSSELIIQYSHCNEALKNWLDGQGAVKAKREEIAVQYKTVRDQINQLLRNHASLNAALKEVPELEMYVPEEYMTKFRAPTEPRVRGGSAANSNYADEIGIDRDALTAIAVAHRVTA